MQLTRRDIQFLSESPDMRGSRRLNSLEWDSNIQMRVLKETNIHRSTFGTALQQRLVFHHQQLHRSTFGTALQLERHRQ